MNQTQSTSKLVIEVNEKKQVKIGRVYSNSESLHFYQLERIKVKNQEIVVSYHENGERIQRAFHLRDFFEDPTLLAHFRPVDAFAMGILYDQDPLKGTAYVKKMYNLSSKPLQKRRRSLDRKSMTSIVTEFGDQSFVSKFIFYYCDVFRFKREVSCQEAVRNPLLFMEFDSAHTFEFGYMLGRSLDCY